MLLNDRKVAAKVALKVCIADELVAGYEIAEANGTGWHC